MMARCYHRKCGQTFGGVTGFDYHVRLLGESPWLICLNPESVGLVLSNGAWSRPSAFAGHEEQAKSSQSATP
jgi:hypothetical protein